MKASLLVCLIALVLTLDTPHYLTAQELEHAARLGGWLYKYDPKYRAFIDDIVLGIRVQHGVASGRRTIWRLELTPTLTEQLTEQGFEAPTFGRWCNELSTEDECVQRRLGDIVKSSSPADEKGNQDGQ